MTQFNDNIKKGRWTVSEHDLFLEAIKGQEHYLKDKGSIEDWKRIAGFVKSRSVDQVRTHAQNHFLSPEKRKAKQQLKIKWRLNMDLKDRSRKDRMYKLNSRQKKQMSDKINPIDAVDRSIWEAATKNDFAINTVDLMIRFKDDEQKYHIATKSDFRLLAKRGSSEPALTIETEQVDILLHLLNMELMKPKASDRNRTLFYYFQSSARYLRWTPVTQCQLLSAITHCPLIHQKTLVLMKELGALRSSIIALHHLRIQASLIRKDVAANINNKAPMLGHKCLLLKCSSCSSISTWEHMYNLLTTYRKKAKSILGLAALPQVSNPLDRTVSWQCNTCLSSARALDAQHRSDFSVQKMYFESECMRLRHLEKPIVPWDSVKWQYAQSLVLSEEVRFTSEVKLRLIDLSFSGQLCPKGSTKLLNELKGGRLSPGSYCSKECSSVIEAPSDGSMGMLILDEASYDVFCFSKCKGMQCKQYTDSLRLVAANEFSKKGEMITNGYLAQRSCGTGGHFIPNHHPTPTCASGQAKCDSTGLVSHLYHKKPMSKAANQELIYPSGTFPQTYVDVQMTRFEKSSKRRLLLDNPEEMALALVHGEDRVSAIRALCQVNHVEQEKLLAGLKVAFDAVCCPGSKAHAQWEKAYPGISKKEATLLEYACCTGEMRNHYAAAAHCDGTKSQVLESMFYANYPGLDGQKAGGTKESNGAHLHLPTLGVTIRVIPGTTACHSILRSTYHLADSSRGTTNFAMLSGH